MDYRKLAKQNKDITGFFEGCHVHHIDFDRNNNNITNLRCMNPSEHRKLHQSIRKERSNSIVRKPYIKTKRQFKQFSTPEEIKEMIAKAKQSFRKT